MSALESPMGVTSAVRELTESWGVSERTGWRWVAKARAEGVLPRPRGECAYCSHPLPLGVTLRRRFCSARCRVYSHRGRPPVGLKRLKPPKRTPGPEKGEHLGLERCVLGLLDDPEAFVKLMGPNAKLPTPEQRVAARKRLRAWRKPRRRARSRRRR